MKGMKFGDVFGSGSGQQQEDAERTERVRTGFRKKLRATARHIPFAEDAAAAYFCAFDSATPLKVRMTLIGALAYFIMPVDAIPDFMIGLGFADDATVLMTALALLRGHVKRLHYKAARLMLDKDGAS
jgi:uncharacterized membrane protein YkvA (DUF1232 family)